MNILFPLLARINFPYNNCLFLVCSSTNRESYHAEKILVVILYERNYILYLEHCEWIDNIFVFTRKFWVLCNTFWPVCIAQWTCLETILQKHRNTISIFNIESDESNCFLSVCWKRAKTWKCYKWIKFDHIII